MTKIHELLFKWMPHLSDVITLLAEKVFGSNKDVIGETEM